MHKPDKITLLFLILLLVISSALYYPRYYAQQVAQQHLATILAGPNGIPTLPARSKSSDCARRGALPDSTCTPGAIFRDVPLARMCTPGYSKTVRKVSQKLHKQVYREYSIPYPQPHGSYEVDHVIPLAIGGSNDIANLFPQPASPAPGFKEKDIVEVFLQEEVCAHRVALSVAQEQIARNWLAIYTNLSPEQIDRIKSKYRSWAN